METFILDTIVGNVLFSKGKKNIQTQINNMNKLFKNSFVMDITEELVNKRIQEIMNYNRIVDELKKYPVIVQRSEEWYKIRESLITASDFGQALKKGKFGSQKDFYKKKCGYEENTFDASLPALQWGIRYEEVANMFYKLKFNVNVDEFGLLPHPKYPFLGASPDGISNMGIMLEIKCPWKRKRTDVIPEQYYYQIQGQLEVCNLEECDYLECYIQEYDDFDSMIKDKTYVYKGQVWELPDGKYKYGNINEFYPENTYKCYYYGIKDWFVKRVKRDRSFFEEIFPQLKTVWDNVLLYRGNQLEYKNAMKNTRNMNDSKIKKVLFRTDIQDEDNECV